MKLLVSIYDETTEKYHNPFVTDNIATAYRDIRASLMNGGESLFLMFPEKFTVHVMGSWDEEVGISLDMPDYEILSVKEIIGEFNEVSNDEQVRN